MADTALDLDEIRARYARIAADFDARLAGVADLEWNHQTPCAEWNTRDLLAHVVDTHRRILCALDGSAAEDLGDRDDAVEAWRLASGDVVAALADEDRALARVKSFVGEQPFAALAGGLLCADTLIHTWDLARATAQDETLDAPAVDAAMALLTGYGDGIRSPGGFGPAIECGPGADSQTALLSYCGRAV